MNRPRPLAFALLLAPALAAGPAPAQDAASGAFLYFTFCATCHGADGAGAGPMAQVLKIAPPDLTDLAAANGGTFPTARVIETIEGTAPLSAHGRPMPLYARVFDGAEPALAVTETGERQTTVLVLDLLAYLAELQSEPAQ